MGTGAREAGCGARWCCYSATLPKRTTAWWQPRTTQMLARPRLRLRHLVPGAGGMQHGEHAKSCHGIQLGRSANICTCAGGAGMQLCSARCCLLIKAATCSLFHSCSLGHCRSPPPPRCALPAASLAFMCPATPFFVVFAMVCSHAALPAGSHFCTSGPAVGGAWKEHLPLCPFNHSLNARHPPPPAAARSPAAPSRHVGG